MINSAGLVISIYKIQMRGRRKSKKTPAALREKI
jgi:hypothetical protein